MSESAGLAQAPTATTTVYAVTYGAGPTWKASMPPQDQDLGDHFAYVDTLFEQGILLANGPFQDRPQGFYLYLTGTSSEVQRLTADDPAVRTGVLRVDRTSPWTLLMDALDRELAELHTNVLEYTPGLAWEAGKPLSGQRIEEHVEYMGGLFARGRVLAGGPVDEQQGGRYLVAAADEPAVAAIVEADPGVRTGLFRVEVRPWSGLHRQSAQQALRRRGELAKQPHLQSDE